MKHIKKRISKIIDELVTYFFSIGATDMTINIKEERDFFKVFIRSNYLKENSERIGRLKKCLKLKKQEEMEEYYWELTGECDIDTELTLVGMMTDKSEVKFFDDTIEVTLYRYKENPNRE